MSAFLSDASQSAKANSWWVSRTTSRRLCFRRRLGCQNPSVLHTGKLSKPGYSILWHIHMLYASIVIYMCKIERDSRFKNVIYSFWFAFLFTNVLVHEIFTSGRRAAGGRRAAAASQRFDLPSAVGRLLLSLGESFRRGQCPVSSSPLFEFQSSQRQPGLLEVRYYSTGGGFILSEEEMLAAGAGEQIAI